MYKAKYIVERDAKGIKIVGLHAVFDFSKEIAPKSHREVTERIQCDEDGQLHRYLVEKEGLRYASIASYIRRIPSLAITPGCWYTFDSPEKMVRVNCKESELKLVIEANAAQNIPLEQILNLDALNKFILTGEK